MSELDRKEFPRYKDRIKEDTLVKDRYFVLEKIGDGCYAKVFLVQDVIAGNGEIYALKAIRKVHFKNNRKLPLMLDKEAKIHRSLDHENIVKLYDYFEDKNYVFFLLDYISPGEIYPILYEEEGFEEEEAADYFYQLVQALIFCKSKNVLHRDLKPENLLLTEEGTVKLADFGWATYKKGSSVVGSVHYNAPEMLRYQEYDYHSDIWSAGVILYELLCCEQPFRGTGRGDKEKERSTERLIKSGRYKMSKYYKRLSRDAQNLISKLLVLDPLKRLEYEEILAHPWMQKNAPQLNGKAKHKTHSRPTSRKFSRDRSIERSRERLSDNEEDSEADPEEVPIYRSYQDDDTDDDAEDSSEELEDSEE